jgi:hypothetical protein
MGSRVPQSYAATRLSRAMAGSMARHRRRIPMILTKKLDRMV